MLIVKRVIFTRTHEHKHVHSADYLNYEDIKYKYAGFRKRKENNVLSWHLDWKLSGSTSLEPSLQV